MSDYIVCPRCGEAFHKDEVSAKVTWSNSNYIGHGGDFPDYTLVCPNCWTASDPCDWEESKACEMCGEPSGDEWFCECCKSDFFGEMDKFFTDYTTKHGCYDEAVYDLLEAYIDSK